MTAQAWRRRIARPLMWLVAVAVGLSSVVVVRRGPDYSLVGQSLGGLASLLLPGFALTASGLVTWARRPSSRSGPLLVAAGLGWFLGAWNNPGIGWAPAFTVGLVGWAVCPPIVAHAVLTFPTGRGLSRTERLFVVLFYINSTVLLGVLPALVFDPAASGCSQCPRNLLRVADLIEVQEQTIRAGLAVGLACALALVVLVVRQLLRGSPALRRVTAPVSAAGAAYLVLVAVGYAHQLLRPVQGADLWDRRLFVAQGTALVAVAAGVGWGWLQAWRTRSSIAGLVIDLASAPPTGGLRDALARMLGDESLQLAYPLSEGELVDATGRPLQDDRPASTLVRGDRTVAVLTHRPGLLDDPTTGEEVARAATLVLDNERLQAELAAQLARLRASRQRIVTAGDAERRRLERDLHDGAQQRLVTLLLRLRVLRSCWEADTDPRRLAHARSVEEELEAAIAELRELAHGVFPAVLADEGLAQAVDAYAEGARIPVVIAVLDDDLTADGAVDPTVEAVAYHVMAESIERSNAQRAVVSMTRTAGVLLVEVDLEGVSGLAGEAWTVDVEDRVGAVDGRLVVSGTGTAQITVRAEIPCGS